VEIYVECRGSPGMVHGGRRSENTLCGGIISGDLFLKMKFEDLLVLA
jgi:hypothetical protein